MHDAKVSGQSAAVLEGRTIAPDAQSAARTSGTAAPAQDKPNPLTGYRKTQCAWLHRRGRQAAGHRWQEWPQHPRAAVEAIQREHGLDPDGKVGPLTTGKLGEALQAQSQAPRYGTCGPGTEKLQEQLKPCRYRDAGERDFNHRMTGALKDYQQANNLPVTGLADARTMARLGQQPSHEQTHAQSNAPLRIDQKDMTAIRCSHKRRAAWVSCARSMARPRMRAMRRRRRHWRRPLMRTECPASIVLC